MVCQGSRKGVMCYFQAEETGRHNQYLEVSLPAQTVEN